MSEPEASRTAGAAATTTGGAHGAPRPVFRIVPALERHPGVVRFAQTQTGRLVVIVAFAALAWLADKPAAIGGAALAAFFPAWRRVWVGLATLGMVLVTRRMEDVLAVVGSQERAGWLASQPGFKAAVLVTALAMVVGYVQLAKTWGAGWLRRRPVATFVALYVALLSLVSGLPLAGAPRLVAWALVAGLGGYLWYGAYSLRDRVDRRGLALVVDASAYRPFWGGSNTPIPKAASHLAKIEVRTPEEAAIWQLKAVKLLAWALSLGILRAVVVTLATGSPSYPSEWTGPGIPVANAVARGLGSAGLHVATLRDALASSVAGAPYPAHASWAAIALHLVVDLLDISIFGHVAVAGARMAGFKALRNTHRPLESRSIADFWNRYYYYFKELLVDLFFFPTYVRTLKRHPRLRLFVATLAAAGFGNYLYHYLASLGDVAAFGVVGTIRARQAYAAYALLLAVGIGLSQLRRPGAPPAKGSPLRRVATLSSVLLFYGLLAIPAAAPTGTTVGECWEFLLTLIPRP